MSGSSFLPRRDIVTKTGSIVLLVSALGFLVGCAPPFLEVKYVDQRNNESAPRVKGIGELGNNRTKRIIVIHGMTKGLTPEYSKALMKKVADNLEINSKFMKSKIKKDGACDSLEQIITTTYSNYDKTLVVNEIHYANIHKSKQEQLARYDKKVLGSPAFLNRWMKHNLMIHRFGDAVAYHVGDSCRNRFRRQLQNVVGRVLTNVEQAIEVEKSGGNGVDSDVYIVSHSLGSSVVLDMIKPNAGPRQLVEGRHLKGVYLLANQHSLVGFASEKPVYLNALARLDKDYDVHIAAFSDRDDILSYALSSSACTNGSCVNAILNVGKVYIPFVWKGPVSAHVGYWTNDMVASCIANGCPNR